MSAQSDMPTPRYKIGDKVWYASTNAAGSAFNCPDCNGTGKWKAVSPAGTEADIACPRCDGRTKLTQHSYVACTVPLTIGQVRIEWPKSSFDRDDDPVSYMCNETGIGGGSVYRESCLFDNEADAYASAKAMADEQNAKLDENQPGRIDQRRSFEYQIKQALVGEADQKRRDAEWAYDSLVERICELDTYPIAKKLDEDGEEVGDGYLSCSLTDEQVECIQNSLVKFDDKARAMLVQHRRDA
ncbi:hypothetical protein LZK98_11735 [Sphingomonas cannabina]|uniref:hypothetical protein n=1 Tax=Sphingomonas cannabina TaxID=2899123 RepID=UPI001F2234D4|nr:hypothetical protein [Sphingomonas cannabina]UIJ43762.1 hypothetical protein LZK98_11735 [Sphingomonas cannabina]